METSKSASFYHSLSSKVSFSGGSPGFRISLLAAPSHLSLKISGIFYTHAKSNGTLLLSSPDTVAGPLRLNRIPLS